MFLVQIYFKSTVKEDFLFTFKEYKQLFSLPWNSLCSVAMYVKFWFKKGISKKLLTSGALGYLAFVLPTRSCSKGTQRQFSENICSEHDLRSRIFGTFAVKFLACLPPLGFSNIYKKWYNCPFLTDFYPKNVT